jgi:SAM-dependent methyltransferase
MEAEANRQFVELERTHFWFEGRRRIFSALLERELGDGNGLRVLDVGCGAGGMLELLGRFGAVHGIDSSPELVAFCHDRGFAEVRLGSAYALPAEGESYDAACAFDVIEHIPDDVRALAEMRRVLVPGGRVFVSVPAYQFLYANNDRIAHHERRYTPRRLRRALRAAGFEPIQVTPFNLLLFPAILPAVLAGKLAERVSPPGERTNLSVPIPPVLNAGLTGVMGVERHLVRRMSLPVGHSIVAVARKPRAAGSAQA